MLITCPAVAGTQYSAAVDRTSDDVGISILRQLLEQPEGRIDLGRAKATLDQLVDPTEDLDATLRELDSWAGKVRARIPAGATNAEKTRLLLSTLYEPGPWNDFRPFNYDYSDPYGRNPDNALLSTYFARRQGQCIIMPITVVLLGQKLGLPMTMTTAPYHLIVKYGDEEQGMWTNLDATSGEFHADSGYEAAMRIPPKALENEVYLRPHSQRESVALFAVAVLVPHYLRQQRPDLAIQATQAILETSPKEVNAMLLMSDAYAIDIDRRFRRLYPDPNQIPSERRAEFIAYNEKIAYWRKRAADLGHEEWNQADWDRYLKLFNDRKNQ